MKSEILSNTVRVHFIGIGGIGVSAIARMMLLLGKKVTGSDVSLSPVTKKLKKEGVKIYIGHRASNVDRNTDLVIYTIAVKKNNPELKKAKKLRIKILTYPQALGLLSSEKETIAISGTHGKTTTTAMCSGILENTRIAPTVIVGSILSDAQTNFIPGRGRYFITEACEYQESFLNLSPKILVITNIDNDHLDYFKNLGNIQKAFRKLAKKVPKDGFIVCPKNNKTLEPVIKNLKCEIIDYKNYSLSFKLKVPGKYNIENAQVAMAVAAILGVEKSVVNAVLKNFTGTWRRQEYKGKTRIGALVYDDYAHHPTEVKRSLEGFRALFPSKRIIVVFQPHLYSRTKLLLNDFAKSFNRADKVIIAPIYAAREKKDPKITSKMVAEEIKKYNKNTHFVSDFRKISAALREEIRKNDMIITMGAGDIYFVGEKLTT